MSHYIQDSSLPFGVTPPPYGTKLQAIRHLGCRDLLCRHPAGHDVVCSANALTGITKEDQSRLTAMVEEV